jgi:hypothetical protein
MKEIEIWEPGVLEACTHALNSFPVVMIQFPEVFGLMSMPNKEGVAGLNRVKSRLPNKLYGSVIGDLEKFLAMHSESGQTSYLSDEADIHKLNGSIIRIRIDESQRSSPACLNGTHQGLLLQEGAIRELFRSLERAFESNVDPALFLGHAFSAPLCTSANVSGHPNGSITEIESARNFGQKMGIPLLIRCSESDAVQEKGSYPVLSLEKDGIIIERKGPGLDRIMAGFPAGLFSGIQLK